MARKGFGKVLKGGLVLGLVAAVAGAVVIGWAVWQVRGTPDYWRVIPADDPGVEASAASFEQQFHAALTQAGDSDEPWQLEVETVDVNEWLATRLPQWESNDARVEIPDWIEHPMVATRPNEVILAAELNIADVRKVVSFGYRPTGEPDGVVALELERMRVGKLWLPAAEGMSKLLAEVGQLSPEKRAKFERFKSRVRRVRLEHELEDGRVVSVRDLDLSASELVARCRTLVEGSGSKGAGGVMDGSNLLPDKN